MFLASSFNQISPFIFNCNKLSIDTIFHIHQHFIYLNIKMKYVLQNNINHIKSFPNEPRVATCWSHDTEEGDSSCICITRQLFNASFVPHISQSGTITSELTIPSLQISSGRPVWRNASKFNILRMWHRMWHFNQTILKFYQL